MGMFDENVDPENGVTLDASPALAPLMPSSPMDLGTPPPAGPPPPAPPPQGPPGAPLLQPPVPPGAHGPGGFNKILEMALLGLAAGLGPRRGGGIPQGIAQAHHEADQQRQVDYKNQQIAYDQQQQDLQRQQQGAAQQQALQEKRQAAFQQALSSIRNEVKTIPDKATYDQRLEGFAGILQGSGYRIDANWLRQAVPYVAPSGKQRANEALKAFFENPLTKEQLKNDPESIKNGSMKIDLNGDGVAELVPVQRVMEAAGMGILVDDKGQAVGTAPSAQGDKFQVALKAELAKFRAENRRGPDPKEMLKLVEDATNLGKDTETSDALKKLQLQGAELTNKLKQDTLDSQPTADEVAQYGKFLVEHKMAPSQLQIQAGRGQEGRSFLRKVQAEAQRLDPNFNFEEAESEYQLVKSPSFQNTVRYMDSVTESLPRLQQTANALANGRVRGINALINAGKNQFNSVDLKKFKTDVLFVSDEIAKILQGGGTGSGTSDAKLRQAGEIISTSDSPQAISAALGEASFLMANRRRSLTRGTYLDKPVVDPAQSAREKLMKR